MQSKGSKQSSLHHPLPGDLRREELREQIVVEGFSSFIFGFVCPFEYRSYGLNLFTQSNIFTSCSFIRCRYAPCRCAE